MGTERLKDAERAAGFAMVANEGEDASRTERKPDGDTWQSEGMLVSAVDAEPAKASSMTDWVKGVFGVFGRGAPA
jgi:hypothetical protein